MKFEIKFPDLEEANEFANTLKSKNLRGVKVKQAEKLAEDGSLDMAEFLPQIILGVSSGLATTIVTQVFGLLKNGFFSKNREISSTERVEMAKLELEKNKVDFNIECGDKKLSFKITKGSEEEMKNLVETLQGFEKDC